MQALTPPPLKNIIAALELLEHVNALNENHEITPLGKHISHLPADIRIGKMLMYNLFNQIWCHFQVH
jgi:HrpA-like RNA helicase